MAIKIIVAITLTYPMRHRELKNTIFTRFMGFVYGIPLVFTEQITVNNELLLLTGHEVLNRCGVEPTQDAQHLRDLRVNDCHEAGESNENERADSVSIHLVNTMQPYSLNEKSSFLKNMKNI